MSEVHYHARSGHQVKRLLGLSLGGAKSERTSLTIIDYYVRQQKAFVIDVVTEIGSEEDQTADQVLIDLIKKSVPDGGIDILAVDAPLTYPPCLPACDKDCHGYEKCKKPEVKWMRTQFLRAKQKNRKIKHFTPYSQRPVDLYVRYKYPNQDVFQDETMGANLAPQAVRMNYLKHFFKGIKLVEVWPKLVLYHLQKEFKLSKSEVMGYRNLERGAHIRTRVLDQIVKRSDVFIYERDFKKYVMNMMAFDSLICAWVALQCELDRVVKFKSDLPLQSGWVQIPEL